jgi:undecaprenyl-diphosphatase
MTGWLPHSISAIDTGVYHFLNAAVGNRFLDRFFYYQESNTLLKCGLLVSAYWYFWFRPGPDREGRRATIWTIILATLLALTVNRVISTMAPFRVRPMFEAGLTARPLQIPPLTDLENWSSFPSDHASYLCALAFGLAYLSRRHIVAIAVYTAAWICLPRLYLGVHYFSDIVAGAAIGCATVMIVLRNRWIRGSVAPRVVAFAETQPHWFYAAAFLVMFEMGDLFWDLRGPVHHLLNVAFMKPYIKPALYGLLASAFAMVLTVALGMLAVRKGLLPVRGQYPQPRRGWHGRYASGSGD